MLIKSLPSWATRNGFFISRNGDVLWPPCSLDPCSLRYVISLMGLFRMKDLHQRPPDQSGVEGNLK